MLLLSLSAWILFTLPLGFIQPPATSCMDHKNDTAFLRAPELAPTVLRKRSIPEFEKPYPQDVALEKAALFLIEPKDMPV